MKPFKFIEALIGGPRLSGEFLNNTLVFNWQTGGPSSPREPLFAPLFLFLAWGSTAGFSAIRREEVYLAGS